MDRLGRLLGTYHADPAWQRQAAGLAVAPSPNGNGKAAPANTKAIPVIPGIDFVTRSGMGSVIYLNGVPGSDVEAVTRETAFAAAAYCYAAINYRARKVAEPPLIVVEDAADGTENWVQDHPLQPILAEPSPDFDMGELLYLTQVYLDTTGSCAWVKDLSRLGTVGRLTPFSGAEFRVETASGRLHGLFRLQTTDGEIALPPERVVYFREPNPYDWHTGLSRVDVALQMLNLGKQATATVKDILRNALFPSVVIQADKEWAPDETEWERFQAALDKHATREKKGGPLALTGGGSVTVVTQRLRDLLPGEILDRVEATVAAVFELPPVVLGFEVGLKNSPWSQMAEARRMTYEDTIEPIWSGHAKRLTRQLLRAPVDEGAQPVEENPRRRIAFDTSQVRALQPDRKLQTEIATGQRDIATVNERRQLVGLDPLDDERGEVIVGLVPEPAPEAPDAPPKRAGGAAETKSLPEATKHGLAWLRFDVATKAQEPAWRRDVAALLAADQREITRLAETTLREAKQADDDSVAEFLRAMEAYLSGPARKAWEEVIAPLVDTTSTGAAERLAAELGIAFDALQPGLLDYTQREAAWLIVQVTDTTKQAVRDALQAGLEAGEGIDALARRIRESDAAFGKSRAELIARTETTRVTNGAQQESLARWAATEGATVAKTWLAVQDARTRDAHAALSGTTVGIDETFGNGLKAPGEPNCRCTLLYSVED